MHGAVCRLIVLVQCVVPMCCVSAAMRPAYFLDFTPDHVSAITPLAISLLPLHIVAVSALGSFVHR